MTITATLISEEGIQHNLDGTLTLGRDDDNSIVLKNDRVSRHHARIRITDEGVLLEDLKSSNGTRCNGKTIATARVLQHGDVVEVGPFAFSLELQDGSAADGNATVLDQSTAPEPAGDRFARRKSSADAPEADTPLPGSWVEQDNLESTQFFQAAAPIKASTIERHGDLPQFLLLDAAGAVKAIYELEPAADAEEDVWEVGRQESCDVRLEDPTVSLRHAQLVHKDGRWRLVNLVSSNGIIINGEKRLAVYLSDGDVVQLGGSHLAFFGSVAGAGAASGSRRAASGSDSAGNAGRGSSRSLWLIGAAIALVSAALAAAFFMQS